MKRRTKRFLFTGGGTGGHVTPALAMAGQLKKQYPDAKLLYVGVKGKAEASLVPRAGIPIRFVRSKGFPGLKKLISFGAFAFALGLGCLKALFILLSFRPDLVVATGGYVSAPIVFALTFLRKLHLVKTKLFIHEQNVVLGRLNKLGASFADAVGVSFPETLTHLPKNKGLFVGYPVRDMTHSGSRSEARESLGLPPDARVIFAFGGSQGARTLNRAIVDALPHLLTDEAIVVIHGTGKQLAGNAYNGEADVQERLQSVLLSQMESSRYIRKDFFYDMGAYYAAADLVVCRGGAGTLTEVASRGLASVVIPKANLPGDHQVANARALEQLGAARIVYEGVDPDSDVIEESVDGRELANTILGILNDKETLHELSENARQAFDCGVLDKIGSVFSALLDNTKRPDFPIPEKGKADRVMGLSSGFLDLLLRNIRAGKDKPLSDDERGLVFYKIDGFLANANVVERARGCRMAGLAPYPNRQQVLEAFARSGDKANAERQAPFVRRDACVGLGNMGVVEDSVFYALQAALSDTYFETRSEAALAIWKLIKCEPEYSLPDRIVDSLLAHVEDSSFEVRCSVIIALGGGLREKPHVLSFLKACRSLYFDPIWKVRVAVLEAYTQLVERHLLDAGAAKTEMDLVLITSNGFNTQYPLKASYNRLRRLVNEKGEGV